MFPSKHVCLHAKGKERKSARKGEFLGETSGLPPAPRRPAQARLPPVAVQLLPQDQEIAHSSLAGGIKAEQYSILQPGTGLISPELFMRGILKLLMTLFFKKGEEGKKKFRGKTF